MGAFDLNQCLALEASQWEDSEEYAADIVERFTGYVDVDYGLLAHRLYIEKHGYGFGERAFHWLWKLIVDEMPRSFTFLEVGVFKGQVLSLVRLLANRTDREVETVGVTLLNSFSGVTGKHPPFPDENYAKYVDNLHVHFGQEQPTLVVGDSTDGVIQYKAARLGPYDVVYVDGCHEYDYVVQDLRFYGNLVRLGGLLVVDDSANYLKQPAGFFHGIEDVSLAVRTVIETDSQWKHLLAVMHNRIWRKTL